MGTRAKHQSSSRRSAEVVDVPDLDPDVEASIRRAVEIGRSLTPMEGKILLKALDLGLSSLPLPRFRKVVDVVDCDARRALLIVDAPYAGSRNMHHVLRIDIQTGRTTCIGRELPLRLARKVSRDER